MIDKLLIWLWKHSKKLFLYAGWCVLLMVMSVYFYGRLTADDKTIFIQGKTSNGHHQVETVCHSCHLGKNQDNLGAIKQQTCLACHKEKKKSGTKSNSHRAKFFDAEDKADLRNKLRADRCVTCHKEHKLGRMGVTQPVDFCILCHKDIADDRPSHKDLPFDQCADCHNYHDNSANYSESFIEKHLHDKTDTLLHVNVFKSNFLENYKKKHDAIPLTWSEHNAPDNVDANVAKDWDNSSHALAGVNCQSCHTDKKEQWIEKPDHSFCKSCHKQEVKGFLLGKHGVRLKLGLSAMTTDNARLSMLDNGHDLSCISCHKEHAFDTRFAAVESCLGCHSDQHSLVFKQSTHYLLWRENDEQGVSCATCHLPTIKKGKKIRVQHNQNDNLRPRQKMAKSVCVNCHGLGFSIDALNDDSLIKNNFSSSPTNHIKLLEMWNENLNSIKLINN